MEDLRVIYKGHRGTIRETSACDWYGNENHYKSTGCKFLGAYNEKSDKQRRWAAKLKMKKKRQISTEIRDNLVRSKYRQLAKKRHEK